MFSESNILSRSECKAAAKKGRITVNGVTVKSSDTKIDDNDILTLDGKEIVRRRFFYIMMNKPKGYVCSTDEAGEKSVLELLKAEDNAKNMFPAGRLDKDTVGFLLITNDGTLAHNLLAPKKHVEKTYFFKCRNKLSENDISVLENGVMMDGEMTKPAIIQAIGTEGTITITEGKFHQIKRMFGYVNNEILYLRRLTFGGLKIDESLKEGEYRLLTDEEVYLLRNRLD